MRTRVGGYTIIEVMIFLGISAALFFTSLVIFNTQQANSNFDQSLRDLEATISQVSNNVSSGFYPPPDRASCNIIPAAVDRPPALNSSSSEQGTNEDCVYLGYAMQVLPGANNTSAYAYPVIGNRTKSVSGSLERQPTLTFSEAKPTGAFASGGVDMTKTIPLPEGIYVVSSNYVTTGGSTVNGNVVGFYNSLSNYSTSNGSLDRISVFGRGYPFTGSSSTDVSSNGLKSCLEEVAPCNTATEINRWDLCVQGTNSSKRAIISTSFTSIGTATTLNYTNCT